MPKEISNSFGMPNFEYFIKPFIGCFKNIFYGRSLLCTSVFLALEVRLVY